MPFRLEVNDDARQSVQAFNSEGGWNDAIGHETWREFFPTTHCRTTQTRYVGSVSFKVLTQ